MKALTVQQPWAWAIVHGGKDVENRTRNLAGSYRGPVAIHAGLRFDQDALEDSTLQAVLPRDAAGAKIAFDGRHVLGAFVGVVDLASVHHDSDHGPDRCSPWAQRGDLWHLVLENPQPLEVPIPCKGRLGLWTPDQDVLEQLQAVAR